MPKKFQRGNFLRSDYTRALLSDTAPYEVPIIVSNDGLYNNISTNASTSEHLQQIIKSLVSENRCDYTEPYRYRITKDALPYRELEPNSSSGAIRCSPILRGASYTNLLLLLPEYILYQTPNQDW